MAVTYSLATMILELADRAGVDTSRVDVSLITDDVRGFVVTNTYPCSSALIALSEIFRFDPSNYDGVLHFVPRGADSVATIDDDDILEDTIGLEQSRRADAISVPRVIHLNYHDVDGGLATDKQSSERAGDRRATGEISLQTAVLLDADEAAQAVAINHKIIIEDQKGEVKLSVPDDLIAVTAADAVIIQSGGISERFRIGRCDVHDGYQELTAIRDRQSAYTSDVEGIPPPAQTAPPSSIVGATLIEPLDIHILRDADDSLGYYVAVSGVMSAWQGATIEVSLDGGANYIDASNWTTAAIMGETLDVLGNHPQEFPDETNSVNVRIDTPLGELVDTDLTGMLNRANLAIIGDEIIQFATADEVSEGEWLLSYFLRGRKGTTPAQHAADSRFVLLDRSAIPFVPGNLADLSRTLTFRATSYGKTTDTGTVVAMVFTGGSQKERAPAYLTVRRDGDDAILEWQGVGRIGAGASVAQGAYFLGYRVTIDDGLTTLTFDTLNQSLTEDVSALTPPITYQVQQRNQLTGYGPLVEVTI